jgi:Flp pilus assembly pilin Flp
LNGERGLKLRPTHFRTEKEEEMKSESISRYLRLIVNRDEKGITTVEYAVMLVVVAGAILAGGSALPAAVTSTLSSLAVAL